MVLSLLLACSISVDAIGIGISYGIQEIKIPFSTKLILTLETVLLLSLFLFCGKQISIFMPSPFGAYLGILLLVFLGIWMIVQGIYTQKPSETKEMDNPIQVPSSCDKDHSKHLDKKEALVLGFVLSLDALGTGIGAGASGFSLPLLPWIAALFQTCFLSVGFSFGNCLATRISIKENRWSALSGSLLILIAFIRVFSL